MFRGDQLGALPSSFRPPDGRHAQVAHCHSVDLAQEPRHTSRDHIRDEVAAAAAKQRQARASAWWDVVLAWGLTAIAVVLHSLLAARLGWLDLDNALPTASPATEDIGLVLVWTEAVHLSAVQRQFASTQWPEVLRPEQAMQQIHGLHETPPGIKWFVDARRSMRAAKSMHDGLTAPHVRALADNPEAILAVPLPSPSLDDLWSIGIGARISAYLLLACASVPLLSLLLLLLVLPWAPPSLEPDGWSCFRDWVLYGIETVGIWSLLPVCVIVLLSAIAQTRIVLPFPAEGSILHVELSLGCSLTLYVAATVVTVLAAGQAAVASTLSISKGSSTELASLSMRDTSRADTSVRRGIPGRPFDRPGTRERIYADAKPQSAVKLSQSARGCDSPSPYLHMRLARVLGTSFRQWQWAMAGLHGAAVLLSCAALVLPVLKLRELVVTFEVVDGVERSGVGIGSKNLTLLDIAFEAAGASFAFSTPVILHEDLLSVGDFCGLRDPPAPIIATVMLILLLGPPLLRSIAAVRAEGCVPRRSYTWRTADIMVVAVIIQTLLLAFLGPGVMDSELGHTLQIFARLQSIQFNVEWGAGAWALLIAALCDALGRWGRGSSQSSAG